MIDLKLDRGERGKRWKRRKSLTQYVMRMHNKASEAILRSISFPPTLARYLTSKRGLKEKKEKEKKRKKKKEKKIHEKGGEGKENHVATWCLM
jgi:hypothetical protein